MAVVFGLLAAICSGSGDFFGGLASRHGRVAAITVMSHVAGVATTFLVAPIVGGRPAADDLAWGAVAGISGALAILSLYTGFTRSDIAIVSPIAAVGAAGFPVVYSYATGDRPGALATAGVGVGIVAIWLISRGQAATRGGSVAAGIAYGVGAGLGFGGLLIFLSFVSADAGVWPLAPARAAGGVALVLVAVVGKQTLVPHRASVAPLIAAGALTIIGNGSFILGTQEGSLAVVSVLAAMFPAATVILARVVLQERLTSTRLAGLVLALVAVALVALS